jgi:hypothetical protein
MRWSKTFVFSKVVFAVDFVHRFDEGNLGVRNWVEEEEHGCNALKAKVDALAEETGGSEKPGVDGVWRDTDR